MYILHLSDLLFGTKDDASCWYKQLTSDLDENFGCDCLDALIISGDVAKNSTPEEYEAAKEFIINLMIHFRLRWSEVVIVPGNHDLNFEKSQDAYELKRSKDYSGPKDESHIIDRGESVEVLDPEKYRQRFIHFSSFCKPFLERPYPLEPELQYTLHYFKNPKLLVLGLNSAWQLDHHYKFRAGINSDALGNAIRKINNNDKYKESRLKIAVWHHPLISSFEDRIKDWDFMKQLERNGFRLILHGHIHQARPDDFHHFDEPAWGQIETIAAGSFGVPMSNSDLERNYTLEYHLINWKAKRLTVCSHKRLQPNAAWEKNFIFSPKSQSAPIDSKEKSYCYEIEGVVIPPETSDYDPLYEDHKREVIKAITEGSIVPFLGADINLCGRERKDENPLDWKINGDYPPTNLELAAYIERNLKLDGGGFLDKVTNLLVSGTLFGELPKGLTHEKLKTIAGFANLQPQRVSQYFPEPSLDLEKYINIIYKSSYNSNKIHKFIVDLIKKVYPFDENAGTMGPTPYPLIVTTCFDRTLEHILEDENLTFDLVSYNSSKRQFIYQKFVRKDRDKPIYSKGETISKKTQENYYWLLRERPVILRIYGPVEQEYAQSGENFAMSEDHFLDYLAHDISHQLPEKLWNKLLDGRLWFLGYNLSYWYLRFIIRQIIEEKQSNKPNWLAVQEKSDILNKYLWKKNGVILVDGQQIGSWEEYSKKLEELLNVELEKLSTTPDRKQLRP